MSRAINISFDVSGRESVEGYFATLERGVQRKVARQALRPGAKLIAESMRARIHSKTGLLAGSLRIRSGRGDRPGRISLLISAIATAESFARHREDADKYSEASRVRARYRGRETSAYRVYYARALDKGHAGPDQSPARTPAHPFVEEGFDAAVDSAADVIEETLFSGIKEL